MDLNVKHISLEYPNCTDGTNIYFEVGKDGVTSIKEKTYHPDEYSIRYYYEIWKRGETEHTQILFARMDHFSIVRYQ